MTNLIIVEDPLQEANTVNKESTLPPDTENTADKIIIHRMAITLLDMDKPHLIFAKEVLEIDINNTPTFSKFFNKHIRNTRTSPKAKECKFDDFDANIITKIERYKSQSLEKNSDINKYFLTFANDAAQLFFTKFKSTSSKSNGSFFIIEASVDNNDKIIFLKIDPQKGVQLNFIEEKLDDDTKDIRVALKEILDVLPNDEKSIQKSSIINVNFDEQNKKLIFPKEDTHLFVLDNQGSGKPSQFFIKEFLDASPIPDDEFKTIRAMKTFTEFLTNKFTNIAVNEIRQEISKQFPSLDYVELESVGKTLLKKFYSKNSDGEYITGEKDEHGKDILAPIDEDVVSMLNFYTSNNEDYSTGFLVIRNESKITYKGKQLSFNFDKVLKDDKVIVKYISEKDQYEITVKNAKELGFELYLK